MFGIFAQSFMTAARAEPQKDRRDATTRHPRMRMYWLDEDLPRHCHADRRAGCDD